MQKAECRMQNVSASAVLTVLPILPSAFLHSAFSKEGLR